MFEPDTMDEPRTLSIPEAGRRYFGLSAPASYRAAKNGYIPVVALGKRRFRVSVPALESMLASAAPPPARRLSRDSDPLSATA
jgi:hypothetical protein